MEENLTKRNKSLHFQPFVLDLGHYSFVCSGTVFSSPGLGAGQVKHCRGERERERESSISSEHGRVPGAESDTDPQTEREVARVSKTTLSAALASLGKMFCRVMNEIFNIDSLQKKIRRFCSVAALLRGYGSGLLIYTFIHSFRRSFIHQFNLGTERIVIFLMFCRWAFEQDPSVLAFTVINVIFNKVQGSTVLV